MSPPEPVSGRDTALAYRPGKESLFPVRSLWFVAALVVLLAAVLWSTLWLVHNYEQSEKQESLQQASLVAAATIRSRLGETELALRGLASDLRSGDDARFNSVASELLANNPALLRIELRFGSDLLAAVDAPQPRPRLGPARRAGLAFDTQIALAASRGADRLAYSRPYPVEIPGELPFAVTELAVPVERERRGTLLAVYSLSRMLDYFAPAAFLAANEVTLGEVDGSTLARPASGMPGAGVYRTTVPLELAGGRSIWLRADSRTGEPKIIPNLLAGMLVAAIAGLAVIGGLLGRDMRLRARAERALREQYAFRTAMEDSLVTGLRARDRDGVITYVNPAFCKMTGYRSEELVGLAPPLPYWTSETADSPGQAQPRARNPGDQQQGLETVFRRRNGEQFPVLIFDAPLIDANGEQAGWMDSIFDISDQKRIEELSRRQQEKLHQNARMALLGEVSSSLSHELNQPLAAISGYATACRNLLASGKQTDLDVALSRIYSQAERAGQVIRSVNDFVRSRKLDRAAIDLADLMRALEPLIELQARELGVRLAWKADPGAVVHADRTMLEQVILNLTRNAIESMASTPPESRLLEIEISLLDSGGDGPMVEIAVLDRGAGVSPEASKHLFSAFFSTKEQGLGIGLSLCRSVVEQHGGQLRYCERESGGARFSATIAAIGATT
ncbi:MAG: PAS domain S-box protein [Burkholderiaceae bacterium]|nr:PAS domain S-box protein [Burkholderiaceae bacterium]